MTAVPSQPNIFVAYWLFSLDPAFHRLSASVQNQGKEEFLSKLDTRPQSITLRGTYSLAGLRSDADLMLWIYAPNLDDIQNLAISLRQTGLGAYLRPVETYVGVVAPARYDPGHQPAFMSGAAPKSYISVYPFVKTSDWYLLPFEKRRELMAEHGQVGRRYAVPRDQLTGGEDSVTHTYGNNATTLAASSKEVAEGGGVLSNTVDAFGLGDYEFILANESDDPSELCRMMESLRKVEVRRYTQLDTPIFLARLRTPAEAIDAL
ncbi:MAG: Coproheme decarboxylase HemQ (no EC) [Ktedonobacterales bacterium]|jgi:chlorite dismutase|nr:MAG: Coproheme decarboxylase HemQ (no EC) [Ktedonobacterales bacterium]